MTPPSVLTISEETTLCQWRIPWTPTFTLSNPSKSTSVRGESPGHHLLSLEYPRKSSSSLGNPLDTTFCPQNISGNPLLSVGHPLDTTFCSLNIPGNPLLSVGHLQDSTVFLQNILGNPLLSMRNPLDTTICWSEIHHKLPYGSGIPGNRLFWRISLKTPSTPQEFPGILILPLRNAPWNPLLTLRILCKPLLLSGESPGNHLLSVGNSSVTLFCPSGVPINLFLSVRISLESSDSVRIPQKQPSVCLNPLRNLSAEFTLGIIYLTFLLALSHRNS